MRRLACAAVMALSLPGLAHAQATSRGTGAVLRVLDKVTAEVVDIELANGGSAPVGRLQLELGECRYPEGDAAADAFAFVTVRDVTALPVFSGWLIASSPAISALEHRRYDVWVIRCKTG